MLIASIKPLADERQTGRCLPQYILFGFILLFSSGVLADTLRPFTTDGCSLFPNGLPNHKDLWLECCIQHDKTYWLGGTRAERKAADRALSTCVAQVNEPRIAKLMLGAVRVGGSPYWFSPFRWGYGWPYGRGYQPVSPEERALAEKLLKEAEHTHLSTNAVVATAETIASRPPEWAQPVKLAGAPNLHKVTDNLYRSAQPSAEGVRNLKDLGVKTIISLRAFHSDRDEIGDTGLGYEHLFMKTWSPEREDVIRFLKTAIDSSRQPVLVHCQHGADRTGSMLAVYRVVVEGWSMKAAAQEMTEGGYGFHEVWVNLIPWLNSLDMESIRKEVGIPEPQQQGR